MNCGKIYFLNSWKNIKRCIGSCMSLKKNVFNLNRNFAGNDKFLSRIISTWKSHVRLKLIESHVDGTLN